MSKVQFDGSVSTKITRASGHCWSSSPHTYQSAFGFVRSWRDSWNHGWASEVWFITMSAMTRMPRRWASSINSTASSTVPKSGCTVRKSEMSYPPSRSGDS